MVCEWRHACHMAGRQTACSVFVCAEPASTQLSCAAAAGMVLLLSKTTCSRQTAKYLECRLLFPQLALNAHALGLELPGQRQLSPLQHGVIGVHSPCGGPEWNFVLCVCLLHGLRLLLLLLLVLGCHGVGSSSNKLCARELLRLLLCAHRPRAETSVVMWCTQSYHRAVGQLNFERKHAAVGCA